MKKATIFSSVKKEEYNLCRLLVLQTIKEVHI